MVGYGLSPRVYYNLCFASFRFVHAGSAPSRLTYRHIVCTHCMQSSSWTSTLRLAVRYGLSPLVYARHTQAVWRERFRPVYDLQDGWAAWVGLSVAECVGGGEGASHWLAQWTEWVAVLCTPTPPPHTPTH